MKDQELVNALSHLKVETGSLACIGCGYEHNCSIHGCAIVRKVADTLSALTEENSRLRAAMRPNCIGCEWIHPDNGNCTIVGGFCTAVPAAHCPLIPKLRAQLEQVKRERDGIKVAFEDVASKPDCNTCCDRSCMYRPRAGETTRFNCPLWRGP